MQHWTKLPTPTDGVTLALSVVSPLSPSITSHSFAPSYHSSSPSHHCPSGLTSRIVTGTAASELHGFLFVFLFLYLVPCVRAYPHQHATKSHAISCTSACYKSHVVRLCSMHWRGRLCGTMRHYITLLCSKRWLDKPLD